MDAAITRTERMTACDRPECKVIDHRQRHKANARAWHTQYLRCLNGELPAGAEAQAIWDAMVGECRKGNIPVEQITTLQRIEHLRPQ